MGLVCGLAAKDLVKINEGEVKNKKQINGEQRTDHSLSNILL